MLSTFGENINIAVGSDLREYSHMSAVPNLTNAQYLIMTSPPVQEHYKNIKSLNYCSGSFHTSDNVLETTVYTYMHIYENSISEFCPG